MSARKERKPRQRGADGKTLYRCAARPSRARRCPNYTDDTYGGVQVCAEHARSLREALLGERDSSA